MDIENLRAAGAIAAKIKGQVGKLAMEGESYLDIAETIEQMIREAGAEPAFPVNLGMNEVSAHDTPEYKDTRNLEAGLLKVDFGVKYKDGLVDTAVTIDLTGEHQDMIDAANSALKVAIDSIKEGVSVGDVGSKVEDCIKEAGFKPISNLTGHMISDGTLHAGIEVPNIANSIPYQFKEGDVFALEPFVTTGKGTVNDRDVVEIFSLDNPAPVRSRAARMVIIHVAEAYHQLPFAERWLINKFNSKLLVSAALRELLERGILKGYPVLVEDKGALVAQSEATVVVKKDRVEVLTGPVA
ncbi:MAG: type II methionyl aminopeptidase [Candidatus Anstonellales archaeon]